MNFLKTKLFLAFFISTFFLFGLAGVSKAATYYVSTTTPIVDGDTFCGGGKCTSSDTIIIRGGARGGLLFQDFDGAGSYITITNENKNPNSKVVIDGKSGFGCLSIFNCKYIDLRGNNDGDLAYGIKVINDMTSQTAGTVWVYGESDHIKLSYLEATCEGSTSISGIGIQLQDSNLTSAWIFNNFEIHHNYIHDTRYSGMYLGHNDPGTDNNPYVGTFSIHDNLLEDMGSYGITFKGVKAANNYIYNNTIRRTGLVRVGEHSEKNKGIGVQMFEPGYIVEIYSNWIEKTMGSGLMISGTGHLVHDNIILGCGTGNDEYYGHGIRLQKAATNVKVDDNIIIQATRYGIYSENRYQIPISVFLNRNLIGDCGLGESWGPNLFEGIGADANWYEADVADFNFNVWSDDNDYSNDDFTFGPGDAADPIVTSFASNKTTVNTNDSITFSWTVTDETSLKQVELYRKIDAGAWIQVPGKIQLVSGTSASGIFTDVPTTAGVYQYGLHVVDQAGNIGYEPNPPGPISVTVTNSADHSWYFSQSSGSDTAGTGLIGSPWESLAKAKIEIDKVDGSKTVNLFFKRGDTWTVNTLVKRQIHGFEISSSNPIVNMDAYGSGNKPCIDGGVADFSIAPDHNVDIGPLRWSEVFRFSRPNCSISNMEFKRIYGDVLEFKGINSFYIGYCNFHDIGQAANKIDNNSVTTNSIMEYNTVHTCQELWRYGKRSAGWGGGISFSGGNCYDNIVRYNLVYDIFGEGINNPGGITEYNTVGDTYSVAIYPAPLAPEDAHDVIVRYNLVLMSGSSDYRYPYPIPAIHDGRAAHNGIGLIDERDDEPGSNSNSNIEIYGNIVINAYYGIYAKNHNVATNGAFQSIKIYNNLVIDCDAGNYIISYPEGFLEGYIYNNSSILYDRTTGIHGGYSGRLPHPNWTIDNNHFWTTGGSLTVDDGWRSNMITTDPKLFGEPAINWDGQSGATYYKDIKFSDVYPLAGSSLIGSGKTLGVGYNKIFLTTGTDFSTLPNLPNFVLSSQTDGSWDIGAVEYGGVPIPDPPIPDPPLPDPPIPDTCESKDYQCCDSCHSGEHSEYDSTCPIAGQVCCEYCSSGLPPLPLTCEGEGYKCCSSPCKLDAPPEYNSDCASGICCAVCSPATPPPLGEVGIKNPSKTSDFSKIIENALMWLLSIVGSLALLILIAGGVMYISSAGDEQKVLTAKKIFTYAVIGLILVLLSYSIIKVLSGIMT